MPDLDVHTADGPTRVFTLLHDARPVLLDLDALGGFDVSAWSIGYRWSMPRMPACGSFRSSARSSLRRRC
jgi:hypothetical protein